MKAPFSPWIQIPVLAVCGAGVVYGGYHLYLQAVGSTIGAIVVGGSLGAWLIGYVVFLCFRMKLTTWLRNSN